MKHTPGPWRADKGRSSQWIVHGPYVPRGGNYRRIAAIGSPRQYSNPELDAEIEANAHLIAAAPELMEALESILKRARHGQTEPDFAAKQMLEAIERRARAAIAKAKGET